MPPVDVGEHLIEILFEVGPIKSTGMATAAINDLDLLAWQLNQETKLSPWECQCIRHLSIEYANAYSDGQKKTAAPPYVAQVITDGSQRQKVNDAFRRLAASRKRKR